MGKDQNNKLFGTEKSNEFNELKRKALNMDPFLLFEKYLEIDKKLRSIFPDIDKILSYKQYSDNIAKYFSKEGADTVFEDRDLFGLNDATSKGIVYALNLKPVGNGRETLFKEIKTEFSLITETFNSIAESMAAGEGYEVPRSYNQFIQDRKLEVEKERERINSQSVAERMDKPELPIEAREMYQNMIIQLAKELKETDSIISRDSDEYKKLSESLQHTALFLKTTNAPRMNYIQETFQELSSLADKYLKHVPKSPSTRQQDRSDVCNAIKAVSELAQKEVLDPRAALEKGFMKILVYNEDKAGFMRDANAAVERATDIYANSQAKAEVSKLALHELIAPTQKNLATVTKTYEKAIALEKKENDVAMLS